MTEPIVPSGDAPRGKFKTIAELKKWTIKRRNFYKDEQRFTGDDALLQGFDIAIFELDAFLEKINELEENLSSEEVLTRELLVKDQLKFVDRALEKWWESVWLAAEWADAHIRINSIYYVKLDWILNYVRMRYVDILKDELHKILGDGVE